MHAESVSTEDMSKDGEIERQKTAATAAMGVASARRG
jgi:hypothetical protein